MNLSYFKMTYKIIYQYASALILKQKEDTKSFLQEKKRCSLYLIFFGNENTNNAKRILKIFLTIKNHIN